MKRLLCLLVFLFILVRVNIVRAEYMLPYPSYMPGNKLYSVSKIIDFLRKYWYFGNLAKIKYYMALSDKLLVEAKTLFEYNQYALAMRATMESSDAILQIPKYIEAEKAQKIDIHQFQALFCEELVTHQTTIHALTNNLPLSYTWREEKKDAVELPIREILEEAAAVRRLLQESYHCL